MGEFKRNPNKVGGIWVKTGPKGEWFSISIGDSRYTANVNNFKKKDTDPDFVVYLSDFKPEVKNVVTQQQPTTVVTQQQQVKKSWKQ